MSFLRTSNAYLATSTVLVGAAIPDFGASFMLLAGKFSSRQTAVWKLAVFTWISLGMFLTAQFLVLDFISSPYKAPSYWFGTIIGANYFSNFLVTVGISILLVLRIRIFYGKKNGFYKAMLLAGFIVGLLKGAANALGVYISYKAATLKIPAPQFDPNYKYIAPAFAISMTGEGIFAIVGTLSFISFLRGDNTNSSKLVNKEIFRIAIISILNIICVALAIWITFDDNYINHSSFWIPSLIYSMELFCFLDLSYNSARAILSESADLSNSQSQLKSYERTERVTPAYY